MVSNKFPNYEKFKDWSAWNRKFSEDDDPTFFLVLGWTVGGIVWAAIAGIVWLTHIYLGITFEEPLIETVGIRMLISVLTFMVISQIIGTFYYIEQYKKYVKVYYRPIKRKKK